MAMIDRISKIATRLNADCERVSLHLFGESNWRLSNRREWRWGEHGRFRLRIAGSKRGKWDDFGAGDHGDMLDLIGRELGMGKRGAVNWALDWLGGDFSDDPGCPNAPRPSAPDSGTARQAQDTDAECSNNQKRAFTIWREARPVLGTLAEDYLMKERGLPLPSDVLAADAFRFHPALYYNGSEAPDSGRSLHR